ncbi:MAG: acyl-CoA dehydrogenase family protein, partial [Nocardioidaceae bacterium]
SSRKLARQTFYGMSRWQAKLEHRQVFLGRIVDIGAELFAMAAACSRAEMLRSDAETESERAQGEAAYELADAFCQQARLRVEELFGRLWSNTDDLDRRIARQTLDAAYSWVEAGVVDPSEGTGPWIASWQPGPSDKDNVARRYR